jgi:hypothetical protein
VHQGVLVNNEAESKLIIKNLIQYSNESTGFLLFGLEVIAFLVSFNKLLKINNFPY